MSGGYAFGGFPYTRERRVRAMPPKRRTDLGQGAAHVLELDLAQGLAAPPRSKIQVHDSFRRGRHFGVPVAHHGQEARGGETGRHPEPRAGTRRAQGEVDADAGSEAATLAPSPGPGGDEGDDGQREGHGPGDPGSGVRRRSTGDGFVPARQQPRPAGEQAELLVGPVVEDPLAPAVLEAVDQNPAGPELGGVGRPCTVTGRGRVEGHPAVLREPHLRPGMGFVLGDDEVVPELAPLASQ